MSKECAVCKREIEGTRGGTGNSGRVRFCSPECRILSTRGGKPSLTNQWGVNSAGVGAITELVVSVDLMKRGYDVFRALSSGTCDLVAIKSGQCYRIEVKSGYFNLDGVLHHTKVKDKGLFDILAIATDGAIVYDPPLV